jgi:hypothetical protein
MRRSGSISAMESLSLVSLLGKVRWSRLVNYAQRQVRTSRSTPGGVNYAQKPLVTGCGKPRRPHDARSPDEVPSCADAGEGRQEPQDVARAFASDPHISCHRAPDRPHVHAVRLISALVAAI